MGYCPVNKKHILGKEMAKGMILAAGQGSRVRPLTKDLPKPMVPILGKPVMEYLIEHLARYGITEIMVNVAYHHKKIEEYFGDGRRWGVNIGYSYEGFNDHGDIVPKPKGSAGGMKQIQDFGGFFDETTLVICGDAIIDLDLGAALVRTPQQGCAGERGGAGGAQRPGAELRHRGRRCGRQGRVLPGKAKPGGGQVEPGEYRHLHFRAAGAGFGAFGRRVRYRQPAVSADGGERLAVLCAEQSSSTGSISAA